jgi:Fur family iron response transcriptional regulator
MDSIMRRNPSNRASATARPAICSRLKNAGLRPTRQRIALAKILFCRGNRHLTVENVYDEAMLDRIPVSLATVYNTLHQFTESGLLRQVAVASGKTFFDADTSEHPHFFIEEDQSILDVSQKPYRRAPAGAAARLRS